MAYKEIRQYSDEINKNVDIIFPAHFHIEIEIVFVLDGKLILTVGNNQFQLNTHDIAVIPSNSIHFYDRTPCNDQSIEYIIVFSSEMLYYSTFVTPFVITPADFTVYLEKFDCLKEAFDKKEKFYNIRMQSIITDICYHICCEQDFDNSKNAISAVCSDSKLKNILEHINNNISESLDFDELCTDFQISPSKLRRDLKNVVGMKFSDYVRYLRVCLAESMLRHTDQSITDICYNCGFESIRTFNRNFLEVTGLTPNNYRKKINL